MSCETALAACGLPTGTGFPTLVMSLKGSPGACLLNQSFLSLASGYLIPCKVQWAVALYCNCLLSIASDLVTARVALSPQPIAPSCLHVTATLFFLDYYQLQIPVQAAHTPLLYHHYVYYSQSLLFQVLGHGLCQIAGFSRLIYRFQCSIFSLYISP